MQNRIPPQSLDAESLVLGSCLLSESATITAIESINASDFYRDSHRKIFSAIIELFGKGITPDIVSVCELIKNDGNLDTSGGPAYVASLTDCIPVDIENHCNIIKETSLKRSVISSFGDIVNSAYNGGSVENLLNDINDATISLSRGDKTGPIHINEIVINAMDEIVKQARNKDPVHGISTGLADLDVKTGGLQKGEYLVLAGRPGTGKTSLALKFANEVAGQGEGVLFFSLEMKSIRLVKRILASGAGVSGSKMKTGYLSETELSDLGHYAGLLGSRNVFIDDTSGLTIAEITARAKRIAMQHDIGMIVVDYVQLSKGHGDTRALEVGQISAGLLGLAKDLNVAMVALSQLNRNVESRTDKRPMISDLKESGALEQDADVILLLYRDELYNKNDDNPHKGIAEIIIGKGRDIGNWTVKVGFNGERTEFFDLSWSN